jgi:hypothetical protein
MLGILRMKLDDTIDGLLTLADSLFPQNTSETLQTPEAYLKNVKNAIVDILKSHGMGPDIKMTDDRLRSCRSKV